MSAGSRSSIACFAISLLLALGPLATGLTARDVVVPEGTTLVLDAAGLSAARDLVIDGVVVVPDGIDALRLEAGRDVVIRGAVVAAHGAAGAAGADVLVRAAGTILVAEGARIVAGAGGHGLPTVSPDARAYGMHGGRGGDVTLTAANVRLVGDVLVGAGGRGGDAYGLDAFGGDAGRSGALHVNGALADAAGVEPHPQAAVLLRDVLPETQTSHCGALPATGLPAVPSTGANGGDACAHGGQGATGSPGPAGYTDNCSLCGAGNYPPCSAWVPVEPAKHNGIKGGHGGAGLVGAAANAIGGKGSDVASASLNAGNGGNAAATGGKGGTGGAGGHGGGSGSWGVGCQGGNGGNGGVGGAATAKSGDQGLNLIDCTRNGVSGAASASAGPAGSGGAGGAPGVNSITGNPGPWGYPGGSGAAGSAATIVPATVPCTTPGAPAITVSQLLFDCTKLKLLITSTPTPTTAGVATWQIWRGVTPTGLVPVATVPYSAPSQIWIDSGLTNGTTYYYKVRGTTSLGYTPFSSVAAAAPSSCFVPTVGPSLPVLGNFVTAPTLAGAPGPGIGQALLTIMPPATVPGITGYKLARSLVSGGQNFLADVNYSGPFGDTFLDLGPLLPATAYYYQVYATTSTGATPWSNEVVIVTPILMQGWGGDGHYSHTRFAKGAVVSDVQCGGPMRLNAQKADGSLRVGVQLLPSLGGAAGVDGCASARAAASRDHVSGRDDVSSPTPAECRGTDSLLQYDAERTDYGAVYHLFRQCSINNGGRTPMVTYSEDVWLIVHDDGSADYDASRWWNGEDGSFTTERTAGKALRPAIR